MLYMTACYGVSPRSLTTLMRLGAGRYGIVICNKMCFWSPCRGFPLVRWSQVRTPGERDDVFRTPGRRFAGPVLSVVEVMVLS
jgi:hypothetical protein